MKLNEMFGRKRLNLDIAVSEPEADDAPTQEASPPEPAPAVPPPDPEPPVAAVTVIKACNAADVPRLAELILQTPHTQAQLDARIAQAKAVRAVCITAGVLVLADSLILEGADEAAAKLATWDHLVARLMSAPVNATPPVQKQTLNRAAFAALPPQRQREYVVAGGQITD